jgi:signal transduction histidine kinase
MKVSLKFKILGSFALIVLLALGLAVGTGNKITRSRYDDYAYQRDWNRAESLSGAFGEWTSEAVKTGTPPPFPPASARFIFPSIDNDSNRQKSGGMMSRMMDGRMPMEHMGLDRMVVTDLSGNVLLDVADYRRATLKPDSNAAILIKNAGDEVGYLYVGRMIPDLRRPDDVSVLRVAGMFTWFITGLIFIFAMILGLILTRHIIGPVIILNRAALDVEGGDLSVRVPEDRRDELGDLSRGFNSMTSSLESADKQRRRLIADSAHELRTPISLIRARIEMMEEGIYPMDRNGLSALSAESERLTRLVDELKILANLESPDLILQRENLNLPELIGAVVRASAPAIHRSGIEIEVEERTSGEPIEVGGDREKLHRLLANLVSNALHHAESRILIHTRTAAENPGWTEIVVEDDGPGIAEEDRERVFERYYRADASRNRSSGGTGLGLAICSEIVKAHGGNIEAGASLRLGGAAMKVMLPPAV